MESNSTKPLTQKLDLKEDQKIILLNIPEDYGHLLHPIPAGVSVYDTLQPDADFIQFFTTSLEDLETNFDRMKQHLTKDGCLWISWKKTTNVKKSDAKNSSLINENKIRELGLKHGLVDIKVIAVNDTWSALKFVYRLKDRK